jgi:hypothetical protein
MHGADDVEFDAVEEGEDSLTRTHDGPMQQGGLLLG